jgi:hypothetical protein
MGIGVQRNVPYSSDQFDKRRISGNIDPQGQQVHKEADQALGLDASTIGQVCPEDNVALPRRIVHETLESGQHRHEHRCALLPSQCPQTFGDALRHGCFQHGAAVGLNRGASLIRR